MTHTVDQVMQVAVGHHSSGRYAEAESLYRQVLAAYPDHAEALHNLGLLAHVGGRRDIAVELIQRAIALSPDVPIYHSNLGEILRLEKRLDEAIASCRRAIELLPDCVPAHNNLALSLQGRGFLDEASAMYDRAIALAPDVPDAYNNYATLFQATGRLQEAEAACRKALLLREAYPEAHNNLAIALDALGRPAEAIAAYQRAIQLRPDYAEAYCNMGAALQIQLRHEEAARCYQIAISLRPNDSMGYNNLGHVLCDIGQHAQSIAAYRQALALDPADAVTGSNLLLTLHYPAEMAPAAMFEEHRSWGQRHGVAGRAAQRPHENDPDPNRRLRVGLVSGDFRSHPVACFLEPLLACHDRSMVELICYSDVIREDEVTGRMRQQADGWRRNAGQNHARVAELVRADRIDILVDLAGHTALNRMPLFAHKPAPVQASWLGYPDTSGLAEMDYRLTDEHADPPGMTEQYYTERLVRLADGFLCYRPPDGYPNVAPFPAEESGYVTFGSLNNFAKVTGQAISIWARLLAAVGGSRLLLKAKATGNPSVRQGVLDAFASHGIALDRIEVVSPVASFAEHMSTYGRVDIALDTFPYNGTTTTCEAMWMGVPVATLAGAMHAGRVGVSLLNAVGLGRLAAPSLDGYVEAAAGLAADIPALARLRGELRGRMQRSPLMDAPLFARRFEAVLRQMWRNWCEQKQS